MSVRYASDPFDGLQTQLFELRGLVKLVPPLIDAGRQRRWAEIETRPGDPDNDVVDIFSLEAGEEEGYGFADYDRTLYSTAIVTSWETFHFCCVRILAESQLRYNLKDYPTLERLVTEERQKWDRSFDAMKKRFKDFANVHLDKLPSSEKMLHTRELRNALVHNLGYYTERYLKTKDFRRLQPSKIDGMIKSPKPEDWINSELIPLDCDFTQAVIDQLTEAAGEIREAVKGKGWEQG